MRNTQIFLQVDVGKQIDKVMEVTPATMGGYGLALAVLVVVAYVFFRKAERADKLKNEQIERMLAFGMAQTELLTKIGQRLEDSKGDGELLKDVLREINQLSNLLKELKTAVLQK